MLITRSWELGITKISIKKILAKGTATTASTLYGPAACSGAATATAYSNQRNAGADVQPWKLYQELLGVSVINY